MRGGGGALLVKRHKPRTTPSRAHLDKHMQLRNTKEIVVLVCVLAARGSNRDNHKANIIAGAAPPLDRFPLTLIRNPHHCIHTQAQIMKPRPNEYGISHNKKRRRPDTNTSIPSNQRSKPPAAAAAPPPPPPPPPQAPILPIGLRLRREQQLLRKAKKKKEQAEKQKQKQVKVRLCV